MNTSQGCAAAPSFPGCRHVPPELPQWCRPLTSLTLPVWAHAAAPTSLLRTQHTHASPSPLVQMVKRPWRTFLWIHPPTPAAGFECALRSPAVASPQTTPRRPVRRETLPSAHRDALQKAFSGLDLITPAALHPPCPQSRFHSPTPNRTLQEGKPLGQLVPRAHLKAAASCMEGTGLGSGRKGVGGVPAALLGAGPHTRRTPFWLLTEVRCGSDSLAVCTTQQARSSGRDQSVGSCGEMTHPR